MAPYSYYYLFSVTNVVIVIMHIGQLLYFRLTGKTMLGIKPKPGSVEYKRIMRFLKPSTIVLTFVALMLAIAMSIHSFYLLYRLVGLGGIIPLTIFVLILPPIILHVLRVQFGAAKPYFLHHDTEEW